DEPALAPTDPAAGDGADRPADGKEAEPRPIAKGDRVRIAVTRKDGRDVEVVAQVSRDGKLNIPLVHRRIKASGLTESQLKDRITSEYGKTDVTAGHEIRVTIENPADGPAGAAVAGELSGAKPGAPGGSESQRPDKSN